MMYSTTGSPGIGSGMFWLHLHCFFGAFALVGFILLIVWAVKNLSGDRLRSVTMWLLAIGIIGSLVTAPFAAIGFQWMMGTRHNGFKSGMMNNSMMQDPMMRMMDMMMGHDKGIEGEAHDEHEEMEEMMRGMMNQ